ncbi:hypothetical protein ACFQEQ_02910 [Halolamina salina]|uniref:hypothetical protein n=1 Tax=Halolamina salina TaxID=1220023 RepID=UPI0036199498
MDDSRRQFTLDYDPGEIRFGRGAADDLSDLLADRGFRVEASAGRLTLHDVDAADIDDAVDALAAAGIAYESFTWTEPTLEDVYLELTGESFRESGVAGPTKAPADAEVER